MADKWPLANGNWSNAANWNGGTKPVAGDDVFADGRTISMDESFTVATLRNTARSGGTTGGTFNFSSGGISGSCTSTIINTSLIAAATNLIQVTATTGTVTLNFSSSISLPSIGNSTTLILHSGNCNLNLNGTTFTGDMNTFSSCITKTSTGTITITGNIIGNTTVANQSGTSILNSSAGNTILIGNIIGSTVNGNSIPNTGITQTAGNLTITGNVTGGTNGSTGGNFGVTFSGTTITVNGNVNGGSGTLAHGINFTGTSCIINGNIVGGSLTGNGIITSGNTVTVNGVVTGGNTSAGIASTSANIINVSGSVQASATVAAITSTNANGQVSVSGNIVNVNGKMAIYAPIVWLGLTTTTSARFFTNGGADRTLYSEDTVPNTPAVNNVRSGTIYGAGNTLVGTIVMPTAANVRNGVVYDNGTTGTALFTTSLFLTELSSSTAPVAVRMQNLCTPMILGELMEAYKR
jgi:hypothetical protein